MNIEKEVIGKGLTPKEDDKEKFLQIFCSVCYNRDDSI